MRGPITVPSSEPFPHPPYMPAGPIEPEACRDSAATRPLRATAGGTPEPASAAHAGAHRQAYRASAGRSVGPNPCPDRGAAGVYPAGERQPSRSARQIRASLATKGRMTGLAFRGILTCRMMPGADAGKRARRPPCGGRALAGIRLFMSGPGRVGGSFDVRKDRSEVLPPRCWRWPPLPARLRRRNMAAR